METWESFVYLYCFKKLVVKCKMTYTLQHLKLIWIYICKICRLESYSIGSLTYLTYMYDFVIRVKKMHLHFYNLHSFPYLTFYITTGSLCTIFIILPTLIWKMLLHICAPCFTCVIELLYNSGCHLGIRLWKITDLEKCQSNCENCI